MKMLRFLSENILFVLTIFLLAFIPLYPKKPLLDIANTWVYVRAEDFVVIFVFFVWVILLLRKKTALTTPLTMPIFIFWIVGAIATIHGVLLIFPGLANLFPNVAFLSMIRRIEYMSVFFVAYAGMKDKRFLTIVVWVLTVTLICVSLYGFGQKYFGLPAYLTMNEEFAKGIPIQISALGRVPSTFGGHFDLAAYLVLVIPILVSMVFGFRSFIVRLTLLITVALGIVLLFMTVSRVSFFALLVALAVVLFMQKRKFVLVSLPILAGILIFLFLSFAPSLINRFGSTVKKVDILVDSKSGEVIGQVKIIPSTHFEDTLLLIKNYKGRDDLDIVNRKFDKDSLPATSSAIRPFLTLSPNVLQVVAPNAPTGENLPQGTGYINLVLSPVTKRVSEFFYEKTLAEKSDIKRAYVFYGDFLIKRASAYDLSFTTRYQGEWPHAISAFQRNIFLGSGYSSISLAVDNDYLRLLGEVGILGFASFFAILLGIGIYVKKLLPHVESSVVRSFVVGFIAGLIGLLLNATLIDVFEASKVAFLFWLLTGITIGALHFYQKEHIDLYKELKKVATSKFAIIVYLSIVTAFVFLPMLSNYFVGDDFTWLRWVADCKTSVSKVCPSVASQIFHYFTDAQGFFYRPATKVYFLLMYSLFWLNQTIYHLISIVIHLIVVVLVFILAKKVLKDNKLSALASFLFLTLSGYHEIVFWIASTGHLFNVMFILLSLLFFIWWDEKKKVRFFLASLACFVMSLLFHELGVIVPFFILLYRFVINNQFDLKQMYRKMNYYLFFILPIPLYGAMRYFAGSHWFHGDYSYNLLKLPFNMIGNLIGYFLLTLLGPISLSLYEHMREFFKGHIALSVVVTLLIVSVLVILYKTIVKKIEGEERRIILFGVLFFVISLLPFLGLGNITSRYSYLAAFGLVVLLTLLIKKLYDYLLSSGKDTAIAVVVGIVSVFTLLHVIQIQQLHSDWHEAGLEVNRFFIGIDNFYVDDWSRRHIKLHFVKVPIRVGQAWIFPVGLKDALWFVFQNPDIEVYQWQSVKEAFNAVSDVENEKVFVFREDGGVFKKVKTPNSQFLDEEELEKEE